MVRCANEAEMIAFGEKIGRSVKPHMVITMTGELGAGKTTSRHYEDHQQSNIYDRQDLYWTLNTVSF